MPQFQAHQDKSLENRLSREVQTGFADRYPRSVEHCLRLVTERLQLALDKRDGVNAADATTWRMSPADIQALTQSLALLDQINRQNNAK
jgi:hypothetical protein